MNHDSEASTFLITSEVTVRFVAKERLIRILHLGEAEEQKANAVTAKDRLGVLRKANANASQMDACRVEIAIAEKAAREAQSRADAIDAAVYDLKAVNPREVANADTRSTEEILDSIESHGHTIKDGLARQKDLMSAKV